MIKHLIASKLSAALFLILIASQCTASNRQTLVVLAIKRARTSVVNIHSEKTRHDAGSIFSKGRKINGMGTGIIVDERGYIVTNYHVVAGVDSLKVTIHDGSSYFAQVVSFDKEKDLAIIKVDATRPLPVLPLGTSSDLMLGETVIAVGNAYGYGDSCTAGIISYLSRDVDVNEKQSYKNLIQTDASINPGNSGGPLINLDGDVVGINVAIRAGAQRIGFAIPIDDARKVIAQLLNIEQLSHTYHGLVSNDVKQAKIRELRVTAADPKSPAANAGFQPGDVILKAGNITVTDGVDFERACLGRAVGDKVDVLIRRKNKNEKLTLILAAARNYKTKEVTAERPSTKKAWRILGIRLVQLPEREQGTVGPRYRGGMRVTQVRPNSPAAENGIRQGDILVGLHVWETVNYENLSYIIDHPRFVTFSPLKFYVLRAGETLYGHIPLKK
jgi:serine protease Do